MPQTALVQATWGMLFMVGQCLSTFAFTIFLLAKLSPREPLSRMFKTDYLHDYGKLMFAFVVLWAYLSFAQWLVIWSGNIVEEIRWYAATSQGLFISENDGRSWHGGPVLGNSTFVALNAGGAGRHHLGNFEHWRNLAKILFMVSNLHSRDCDSSGTSISSMSMMDRIGSSLLSR